MNSSLEKNASALRKPGLRPDPRLDSALGKNVLEFQAWRDRLLGAIETFRARLDTTQAVNVEQSLRMYDLIESLRTDRMLLAFIAEYSRGKTELINALFFSGYKRRLLPSDIGRTTMCPTEIFHDPAEAPYLRLLPIETRETDNSVTALKRTPIEWIRISLPLDDVDELAATLAKVVESKRVSIEHARRLGLYNDASPELSAALGAGPGEVLVPAWRHALINFPHPMLTAGLAILDTPGLNALGTEPELTLSMIPNAHAVLFLLAMDTGVTRSDMELWQRHVQNNAVRSVAVLNKVDLIWDDLKSDLDIEQAVNGQLDATALILNLPRHNVLPMSAQKALIARIKGDPELLERSGVEALESLLVQMIPDRRRIIAERVAREFGVLVEASYQTVMAKLRATHAELAELASLRGKNQGMAKVMVTRLEQERAAYQHTVLNFRNTHAVVMKQGMIVQANLDPDQIEVICQEYRRKLHEQLFTIGLMRMMQQLFDHFEKETGKIMGFANQIKGLVDAVYVSFHEKYGFARLSPPQLSLVRFGEQMLQLKQGTIAFCANPATVMQPQGVVIRKFYDRLVAEAKEVFQQVAAETDNWLHRALSPLTMQLKEHEEMLDRRLENLRRIIGNVRVLETRTRELDSLQAALRGHADELDEIRRALPTPEDPPASLSQPLPVLQACVA
jgi:hypothetical protein